MAREAVNAEVGIPNLLGLNALQLLPLLSGQQNQLTLNLNNAVGGGSSASRPARPVTTYKYTVKILNPASAAEAKFIVRQLHNFQEKLGNLDALKIRISTTFNTDVHDVSEISAVGYFEGKQKRWLCDDNDLEMMYKVFSSGSCVIPLWCERSVAKEPASITGKRAPTKRERHEEEVTDIFEDLKGKHKEMELPKLRFWARMIANGVHESTEEPPNVPMITGTMPKRAKRESMHDVVVDAAKAVAQAFTGSTSKCSSPTHTIQSTVATSTATSLTISPSHLADIRINIMSSCAICTNCLMMASWMRENF